jgi:hypothetical protein
LYGKGLCNICYRFIVMLTHAYREMVVAKRLDDVDKAVQQYNMMLTKLRLIGSSAKYQSAGFQLEALLFKPHAPTVNEMLSVDLKLYVVFAGFADNMGWT